MTETIRVLSIDGGGVRGVIPARVLAAIEALMGGPAGGFFDVVAGTSTGGILALGLTAPGPDGRPANSAADLLGIYRHQLPIIFPQLDATDLSYWRDHDVRTIVRQRLGAALLPHHWGNARYLPVGLEDALQERFGPLRLADALVETVVPSYDMVSAQPLIFRSRDAKAGRGPNPLMSEVARATSAAPTYFPPLRLLAKSTRGDRAEDAENARANEMVLVDGGLVANNPVTLAYLDALELAFARGEPGADILVVSLGTGRPHPLAPSFEEIYSRGWASVSMGLISVMMNATSEAAHDVISRLVGANDSHHYFRFQPVLEGCSLRFDDASHDTIDALVERADELIARSTGELEAIAAALSRGAPGATAPFSG